MFTAKLLNAGVARRLQAGLVFIIVLAHSYALSQRGLLEQFNPDDTTNMYMAWIKSDAHLLYTSAIALWEGEVRPVGLLFYRLVHKFFGFNSYPFRVACFAFLLANLALQFRLFLQVFPKLEFASLALLVASFNGALWSIYASTGTIFDILCLFFLLLALRSYIGYLERRRVWMLGSVYLCSILAIQSKEMGYTAPVLLLCYEACYAIPAAGRPYWPSIRRALFRVAPVTGVAALGIGGMIWGSRVMFRLPGYTPHLSWSTFVETNAAHMTMLFYREWSVTPAAGLVILGGTLLLAVALRSRAAIFGWLFYNAALLPISFVAARSDGYVLYTAYTGCAIYMAGVVQAIAEGVASRFPGQLRPRIAVAAALLIAALVVHVQQVQAAGCVGRGFGPGGQPMVGDLAATASSPGAAAKKRVILVDDPFAGDYWQPLFILRLSRNDINLDLIRTTSDQIKAGNTPDVRPGDQILVYSDHVYREVAPDMLPGLAASRAGE
ncbi:MAG TPA: hypothetical protein PLZ95_19095 [Bryobacteraceae bacterium]|nr:hypothetical protein [Bryobacteraceae bacterium]